MSPQQQLEDIRMSTSEIIAMRDEHDRQERARFIGYIVGYVLVLVSAIYFVRLAPESFYEWLGLN